MLAAAAFFAAATMPAVASAHPKLTRTAPSSGETVVAPVTSIRLWFSERIDPTLSSVTLTDSAGAKIPVRVARDSADALALRATPDLALAAGRYAVAWKATASDGHPMRGAFEFSVSASASPAGIDPRIGIGPSPETMTAAVTATPFSAVRPAGIAVRSALYAGIIGVIGSVMFAFLVVGRLRTPVIGADRLRQMAGAVGAISGAVVLAASLAQLATQAAALDESSGTILRSGWGKIWMMQAAAGALALVLFPVGRPGSRAVWAALLVACVPLAAAPGLMGHAGASSSLVSLAVASDTVHVLSASGWLGSLVCVLLATALIIRTGDPARRWLGVAEIVRAFSPTALAFAAAVVVTGLVNAALRVGSLDALTGSAYGKVLLVKLGVFALVALTGAYNWKRALPSLGTELSAARFRKSATVELAIGLAVIVVTAVLVSTETP